MHTLHKGDLPANLNLAGDLAIDSETMGLSIQRDRLCLIQLSNGDGNAHLVQFEAGGYSAPNLKKLLSNPKTTKIFHYARFDIAVIRHYLELELTSPVYCTKIASKLVRTYTDKHGLKDVCRELLGVEISKQQQTSNWGATDLSEEQLAYAASDVLHLHQLRTKLDQMLKDMGRTKIAEECFRFLNTRVELDLLGWKEHDIFSHASA